MAKIIDEVKDVVVSRRVVGAGLTIVGLAVVGYSVGFEEGAGDIEGAGDTAVQLYEL